jgi:hypothetical protein
MPCADDDGRDRVDEADELDWTGGRLCCCRIEVVRGHQPLAHDCVTFDCVALSARPLDP